MVTHFRRKNDQSIATRSVYLVSLRLRAIDEHCPRLAVICLHLMGLYITLLFVTVIILHFELPLQATMNVCEPLRLTNHDLKIDL